MIYEDFFTDHLYVHPYGRTITDADNIWFSNLTMNPQQLHINHDYAEKSEFGKPLVNSCLTLSIVTGLSVFTFGKNVIANLGWDGVLLLAPVYIGDTLYAQSTVEEKRETESREDAGIIKVRTKGFNQNRTLVIDFYRTFMVKK